MFLDVQKSTMLAYLSGRGSGATRPAPVTHTEVVHQAASETSPLAVGSPSQNGTTAVARADHRQAPRDRDVVAAVPRLAPDPGMAAACDGDSVEELASDGTGGPEPDRARITSRLLETVRDRTGYPIETLGLELDMEADLGIDSIKRVEILGKLRDEFPGLSDLTESTETMDALTQARTLGAIVDRMVSAGGLGPAPVALARGQWSGRTGTAVGDC